MTDTDTATEQEKELAKLREPFPPSVVGKLPKGNTFLDYVGHAAVTDRLLSVDPHWNWEPLALDERGLPLYDNAGGLWITLSVCGQTRLGYGDGPDPKQRIGDALRNAAMRFGVALDLWSKSELESSLPVQPIHTADPANLPGAVPEPLISPEKAGEISTLLNSIEDEARRKARKGEFIKEWGVPPEDLFASQAADALNHAKALAA